MKMFEDRTLHFFAYGRDYRGTLMRSLRQRCCYSILDFQIKRTEELLKAHMVQILKLLGTSSTFCTFLEHLGVS